MSQNNVMPRDIPHNITGRPAGGPGAQPPRGWHRAKTPAARGSAGSAAGRRDAVGPGRTRRSPRGPAAHRREVLRAARRNLACHSYAELVTQVVRDTREDVAAGHHLHHAGGVAQVDELHASVVAPAGHPASEDDGLRWGGMLGAQSAGGVGSQHVLFLSCSRIDGAVAGCSGPRPLYGERRHVPKTTRWRMDVTYGQYVTPADE